MSGNVEHEVMEEDFNPTRRGRRPMISIEEMVHAVDDAAGRWVKFEIHNAKEANSVLRQMAKLDYIETASSFREDGGKDVYARTWVG